LNLLAISQHIVTEVSREQISGNFHNYISENHNISTIILFISLITVTSLFVAFPQKITLLFTSLFSQRHFSQLLREGKMANKNLFDWIHTIIFLIQTLFVYIIIDYYFPKVFHLSHPVVLYLILLVIIMIDFFAKRFLSYIYFTLFNYKEEYPFYKLYKLLFNFSNTIFLMFIIPMSIYTDYWKFILLYIPIIMITFLITSIKIFLINPKKIQLLQFFIYFCTLEILPYLVVLKFLITLNK